MLKYRYKSADHLAELSCMGNISLTQLYNRTYSINLEIRAFFRDFFKNPLFGAYFAGNLLLLSAIWSVAFLINLKTADNDIISLNYSVDFGVNLIGHAVMAYKTPLIGSSIFLFNILLISFTYKKNIFTSHVLFISILLSNIALLISIGLVYFINFI